MMKRLKFLLVFVFLLVGTLTVMSFTNDKYRKSSTAWQCLRYTGPQPILSGTEILNPSYWTTMLQNPFPTCDGGYDLCAMCFDNFTLPVSDARQALYDYFRDNDAFPPNGGAIFYNGKMIQVYTFFADGEE